MTPQYHIVKNKNDDLINTQGGTKETPFHLKISLPTSPPFSPFLQNCEKMERKENITTKETVEASPRVLKNISNVNKNLNFFDKDHGKKIEILQIILK